MAEVQSRSAASRGRGSTRGRGGFSSRGGRSSTQSKSGPQSSNEPSFDDQGELGQLKKQYLSQLSTVKEVFPDWTDDDIVFALQETNGDVQSLIERISEGNVFQFEDVKKKQPREKSRVKGSGDAATGDVEARAASSTRGGRSRGGAEGGRGGRGRGSERGRGSARGGRGGAAAAINGSRSSKTATTEAASGWDQAPAASTGWDAPAPTDAWDSAPAGTTSGGWDDTPKASEETPSATVAAAPNASLPASESQKPKSWASMFAKPNPPPAIPKTATSNASKLPTTEPTAVTEAVAAAQAAASIHTEPHHLASSASIDPKDAPPAGNADLAPPKVPLTEANVEHLPDNSGPPPSETVASTRGDPQSAVASAKTSRNASGPMPIGRPSFGSLHKAATQSNRSLSFQRLKEQQDAVVMPGNHAVDRASVQFGQMGLGSTSGRPLDVDDEREDAETRAQPPQQSPSAPRASLPPAARVQQTAPDQPPGLGLPSQQAVAAQSQQNPATQGQGLTQEPPGLEQYRYASAFGHGQGQGAPPQKEYDPFSSQLNTSGHGDARSQHPGGLSQAPGSSAHQASAYGASYNQGPGSSYDSQFTGEQGRYSNYYGYGQHTSGAENQAPQRSTSGFGDQSYGATASASQSRFSEGQASGNNTPNPPMGTSSHQSQHMHGHGHGHGHGQSNYGGGHPFSGGSPYGYYGYGGQYPGQQGFGNHYGSYGQGYGSYGNKGGMYGSLGHHGYGMSSQGSFEHSSSPANTGTFGGSSLPGRDSGMSSNLNEYTRSGSTQPTGQSQNSSAGGFGAANESYGRSSSGFGGQSQGYGAQTSGAGDESLKALHESKTGPSPGLGGNNRPGSGFNATSSGAGYGPPQGSYGSGGGFPGQLNQYGSSGYGLGGLGGHSGSQGHQGGYGSYGGFGGQGSNYGGSGARGGWGSQYSQYGQH